MKFLKSLFVFLAFVFMYILLLYTQKIPSSSEEALEAFYAYHGAEDQLMDPLILAGSKVIPILVKKITDKKMPKRRYAIQALGNLGNSSCLPPLNKILEDASEKSYFRCDALHAIAMIDIKFGYLLAEKYSKENIACLSKMSHKILTKIPLEKRTYWEALLGIHK